jgi:copper chaperone CopZ
MAQIIMGIDGMSCQKCVQSITRILQALPGVERVDVSLEAAQAALDYDPEITGVAQFKSAIEEAGFDVR